MVSLSALVPVTSPYAAVADLVDDTGRARAVLWLASSGEGWYVHEEHRCAAP